MTYVDEIEPRLTSFRPVAPDSPAEVLAEWCRDLEDELAARLRLVTPEELQWQPHPDSNSAGVTIWHVARWIDVLGTRAFTAGPRRTMFGIPRGGETRLAMNPTGSAIWG